MDKGERAVRLLVIEPVPSRVGKKSKLERREPAHLICTDPARPLPELLQAYLWRWDIEVNSFPVFQLHGRANQPTMRNLPPALKGN